MVSWAIAFLVAAVIAAIFGFGGVASAFASVAQLFFFLFAIVFVVMLIMPFVRGSSSAMR